MGFRIFLISALVAYSYQEETATEVPTSTFSCEGRVTGYYADIETGCRTYHYCIGNQQHTYHCPNNTLFQQRIFICNHWYLVDCGTSEQFYNANLLIGQRDKPFVGEGDAPRPPTHPVPYPTTPTTTQRSEVRETTYTVDSEEVFSVPDAEDIQRVQTTATAAPSPSPAAATTETYRDGKANTGNDDERFIRLKFTDPRGLFYIPNGNYSAETPSAGFREFVIPRFFEADVMQFKAGETEVGGVSCPKYCDLRYVRPGTCHPCIMIK